jgi:hypothetical protein
MVGSMLYWSVALGLGGLSLMAASALSVTTDSSLGLQIGEAPETESATPIDVVDATTPIGSILVHLEESEEPEDVNDNAGAAGFTQVNDDQQVLVAPGPGSTSY